MIRDPRMYRTMPVVITILLFLVIGSGALSFFQTEARGSTPKEEVHILYMALLNSGEIPDTLSTGFLKQSLSALDPSFTEIAERVTIHGYEKTDYFYRMEIVHRDEPGRRYRVGVDGVY